MHLEPRSKRVNPIVFAVLGSCAVALGALAYAFVASFSSAGGKAPGFTLRAQDGKPLALSSLRGAPVALFFGYTRCPDACPIVLANLHRALALGNAPKDERVLFVTVDPAHDSPAVLARYLGGYGSNFVGLTGTPGQLEPVYRAYHIAHIKSNDPKEAFEIAHESSLTLIGRTGAVASVVDGTDPPATLASELATNAGS